MGIFVMAGMNLAPSHLGQPLGKGQGCCGQLHRCPTQTEGSLEGSLHVLAVPCAPAAPRVPRSLRRAQQRGEGTEWRLEVHEQLLALRHWLDAVEKRLPEPGPALQVSGWPRANGGRQSQAGPSPRFTEAGEVSVPKRDSAWLRLVATTRPCQPPPGTEGAGRGLCPHGAHPDLPMARLRLRTPPPPPLAAEGLEPRAPTGSQSLPPPAPGSAPSCVPCIQPGPCSCAGRAARAAQPCPRRVPICSQGPASRV